MTWATGPQPREDMEDYHMSRFLGHFEWGSAEWGHPCRWKLRSEIPCHLPRLHSRYDCHHSRLQQSVPFFSFVCLLDFSNQEEEEEEKKGGPGIEGLKDKIAKAHPMVLFALSETPLLSLIEMTQGMTEELEALARITGGSITWIQANFSNANAILALGASIVAPDFVSCSYVLDNISSYDINLIKLSRLRAKQISGIAGLALKILPESQTVGVNVVGGATLSIPNPVTPMTVVIQKQADEFHSVTKKWTKKYDQCWKSDLNKRLSTALGDLGY